jgi:hypothetical protein
MWNNVLYTTRLSGAFIALMVEAADSLPAGWSSIRHTNSKPIRHNTRLQSMFVFFHWHPQSVFLFHQADELVALPGAAGATGPLAGPG